MRRVDERFEATVQENARAFDLKPLVDLLVAHGYPREQMLFESNREGGATALVHAIEFRHGAGTPLVVITVNIGLLGDNGLLPSYFLREIEASRDPQRFYDFIRFFDHRLIENYLRAAWPEDDASVFGDYALVRSAVLKLAGLDSVSSLAWFAQLIFPELRTRVRRDTFLAVTSSHACRTGFSKLDGSSVIGRVYESEAEGFIVDLITEEEHYDRHRTWAAVTRSRLADAFLPVVAPFRLPLRIVLTVLSHASWARLESSGQRAKGYLGYDRIQDIKDSKHSMVVFSGIAGEAELE